MIKKHRYHILTMVSILCAAMILTLMPGVTFAEPANGENIKKNLPESIEMTAGDVIPGFSVFTGTKDPSVAWVDENGNLNALKAGETDLSLLDEETNETIDSCHVTVKPFEDGSDVVGNLKIIARYNSSMQFYDGHSYLIFTSYKDGVTISVPDLYAAYEISDAYYEDIRKDISAGSNHTEGDPEDYFTLRKDLKSMTLNRGGVVTIGMYRDFDLTVPQAALGSLKNSSVWKKLIAAGKTAVVESVFRLLDGGTISAASAAEKLICVFNEIGIRDYRNWIDGTVVGGVCFNRELYNQKLEWDQYENVTYEMEITENQLRRLEASLSGNLNRFSVIFNSCATVVQKAWNAAVGTTPEGKPTAYFLNVKGSGIFSVMDAPKGARDAIERRLKGSVVNNSDGGDPDCGFEDETGWVYVSAPKKMDLGPGPEADKYTLKTVVKKPEAAEVETSVYVKDAYGNRVPLDSSAKISAGTPVYVNFKINENWCRVLFRDITLNGVSISDTYDPDEDAYVAVMPEKRAKLCLVFAEVDFTLKDSYSFDTVLGELLYPEDYIRVTIDGVEADPSMLRWIFPEEMLEKEWGNEEPEEELPIMEYVDETKRVVKAVNEGSDLIGVWIGGEEGVFVAYLGATVYDPEKVVTVSHSDGLYVICSDESGEERIVPSGGMVEKGNRLSILVEEDGSNRVLYKLTCNGQALAPDETITVEDSNLDINAEFRSAEVTVSPKALKLETKGETGQIRAEVKYTGILARYRKVYDSRIFWESSNPSLVNVDENGLATVIGNVPENGEKVILTAKAGSSLGGVIGQCEVEVGDYKGSEIVGRLTIYARPATKKYWTPHGSVNFTAYKDMDLSASYFRYYQPTEKYAALMDDYEAHPENYPSDPALYTEELDLGERESYFREVIGAEHMDPQLISIKNGETITLSNYGFEETTLDYVVDAFENSSEYADRPDIQEIVKQIRHYQNREDYDAPLLFDSLVSVLHYAWMKTKMTGNSPLDGKSNGGITINRELRSEFIQTVSQMPNRYITIEITADEWARAQGFLANPENNYYALGTNNCTDTIVYFWNTTLFDKPQLHLSGNYSGLVAEPESLYAEIWLLGLKSIEGTEAGTDYYPRSHAKRSGEEGAEEENEKTEPENEKKDSGTSALTSQKRKTALNKGCGISVSGKGTVNVKWGGVTGADGYEIYVKQGTAKGIFSAPVKKVKAGNKRILTLKRVNGKKINTKKKYSLAVKAYRISGGKKVYLATSKVYSANGPKNPKYTNVKSVKTKKKAVSLSVGRTVLIRTSLVKKDAKKKLDSAAKKRYFFSSNPAVATVNRKGVVTGVKAGTCTVYCKAADGVKTPVKVTVK